MISLDKVIIGTPILLTEPLYFYQPVLKDIIEMDEQIYWSLINLWTIERHELIVEENEYTQTLSDFDIWSQYIISHKDVKKLMVQFGVAFLHQKIDFLPISNTIIIGENTNSIILNDSLYFLIKALCKKLLPDSDKKDEQYQETEGMSDREKQMIAKMKARQQMLNSINGNGDDSENYFGKKIVGLVAIGHYTFEEVYNMTMLQFNLLLQKYIQIQNFELTTMLSPYIDSKKHEKPGFWLD